MKSITRFIEKDLKLKVNQKKSTVDRPWEVKFLGFTFYYNRDKNEYRILVHYKPIKKFRAKLKELTGRSKGMSMDLRLRKLKQAIRGWVNYFSVADMKNLTRNLDKPKSARKNWRQAKCSYFGVKFRQIVDNCHNRTIPALIFEL
jgi:hypothetical protein